MADTLAWLFETGHAADLVLAVFALEAIWLIAARRLTWRSTAAALLPGVAIVLALRGALTGADWPWIAAALALALPLHLTDLGQRGVWRRFGSELAKDVIRDGAGKPHG
jgi:hypothetical protein